MKLCPNCHRLSKDDDFCSHCGSAVYDDNTEYSVDCSQIPGHTHEKQSFSENNTYSQHKQSYSQTDSDASNEIKKKGKGCLNLIIILFVIRVLFNLFSEIIEDFADFL